MSNRAPQAAWFEWLIDLIWPRLATLTAEQVQDEASKRASRLERGRVSVRSLAGTDEQLADYRDQLAALLASEDERRTSIDARLTSIIGLASLSASLLSLGVGFLGLKATGALWLRITLIALMGYMVLQLLLALRAAIRGIARRGYLSRGVEDEIPKLNEATTEYLRRSMETYVKHLDDHADLTNQKVSQMAVAHCALRNFLNAALVLVVGFVILALYAGAGTGQDAADPSAISHQENAINRHAETPERALGLASSRILHDTSRSKVLRLDSLASPHGARLGVPRH